MDFKARDRIWLVEEPYMIGSGGSIIEVHDTYLIVQWDDTEGESVVPKAALTGSSTVRDS